jgi:predicted transcriptional regulator of viral defense system
MNLAENRPQALLRAIYALDRAEIDLQDVYPLGKALRMSPQWVRRAMSRLEKADKLVRIRQGHYMTMEAYQTTLVQNGTPSSRSSP